jgi:Fic family protein
LLYLSYYLKRHRAAYYDRLTAIRENGDWEGWVKFILRGIAETANEAVQSARRVLSLRESHRKLIEEKGLAPTGLRLLDFLFERPVVNVKLAKSHLKVSFATANKLIAQLEQRGLLEETTGGLRNRRYSYAPYLNIFED